MYHVYDDDGDVSHAATLRSLKTFEPTSLRLCGRRRQSHDRRDLHFAVSKVVSLLEKPIARSQGTRLGYKNFPPVRLPFCCVLTTAMLILDLSSIGSMTPGKSSS